MVRLTLFLACVCAVSVVACANGDDSAGTRRIVVLTPDDAAELVVPEGAFDEEITLLTTTLLPTTTTQPEASSTEAPQATAVESDDASASISTTTEDEVAATAPTTVAEVSSTTVANTTVTTATTTATTTVTTTSTTTSTTTTQPPKETIPIEEDEVNPGIKLMDSLDGFNACLATEGWSFIGIPNQDDGPENPANNPEYIQALILCNSRTNIAEAFQEFQTSRSEMDPDEIREQNEQTILLGDCLRGKGWSVGELTPNEDGLLNPTEFQSPDGDIDTNEIRDCISELGLTDDDG